MSPDVDTPMTTSNPSPDKASYVLFPIEYHEVGNDDSAVLGMLMKYPAAVEGL